VVPVVRLKDRLTVICSTSPVALHPSTELITRSITSFALNADLEGVRYIISCDGVPADRDDDLGERYEEYKERLRLAAAQTAFSPRVELLESPTAIGQAGVVRRGIERTSTDAVLFVEHDWELVRPIPSLQIVSAILDEDAARMIRLNKRSNRRKRYDSVLEPHGSRTGLPLLRTGGWSANPHFASVAHYRERVLPLVKDTARGSAPSLEYPLIKAYDDDIQASGFDDAWDAWRVCILGEIREPPFVRHLDGRQLERKQAEAEAEAIAQTVV
jgi:hypothetical protein